MKNTCTLILIGCLSIQMMAQSTIKQRLDSLIVSRYDDEDDTIGENSEKETYKYGENEQLIERIDYKWNTDTENWYKRYEYTYDENSNPTWYAEYRSDTIYDSNEYNYDTNGNLVLNIEYYHSQVTGSFLKERNEYAYDSNNNRILKIRYWGYVHEPSWQSVYKWEDEYDEYNNKILESQYKLSEDGQLWIGNLKNEYGYDENGNQILMIKYEWLEDNQSWVNKEKYEYNYDENNKEILKIRYEWSEDSQLWVNKTKNEHSYDGNSNEILEIRYEWLEDSLLWMNDFKHEQAYNANNDKTLGVTYKWESSTQTWKEEKKYEHIYDDYGNKTEYNYYVWSDAANEFELSESTTYTNTYYDTDILKQRDISTRQDGYLISSSRSKYNTKGNITYSYSRDHDCYGYYGGGELCFAQENTYTYDESGEELVGVTDLYGNAFYWEGGSGYLENYTNGNLTYYHEDHYQKGAKWYRLYTETYTYDTTYTSDQLITLLEDNNKRVSYIHHYGYGYDDDPFFEGIYYYSQDSLSTHIENPVISDIAIYPNPAEDFVIFDIEEIAPSANVELYNAQGQLISYRSLNSRRLSVNHLNSGVYFYKLYNDKKTYAGKIIVK